jgi:hypothetical protein
LSTSNIGARGAVRRPVAILIATAAVVAFLGGGLPVYAHESGHTLSVNGQVNLPTTYTLDQLSALPQTTTTVNLGGRQVTATGVLLETLVSMAKPAFPASLPNTKNELLRVTGTVRGESFQPVTFALGELDPAFGNHPALVALTQNGQPIDGGPELVVPGDRLPLRFVRGASEVTVGIALAPATNTAPVAGSPLVLHDNGHSVTLTSAFLNRLRQEALTVSFIGPGGTQTHTEVGPPLLEVLLFGGAFSNPFNTWVAAVGSDNYVATVTSGEQLVGGRQLQLSLVEDGATLAQPRLVASGDVHGGRYVSDMVDVYIGTGPAR